MKNILSNWNTMKDFLKRLERRASKNVENMCKLEELTNSEKTYWKFSQSVSGRSCEKFYTDYQEGKISEAKDDDVWLSFVGEEDIVKFVGYGDVLTKICLDKNNKDFQKICKSKVKIRRAASSIIYECKYVLVEKNYTLDKKESIRLIFSMCTDFDIPFLLGRYNSGLTECDLVKKCEKFGYKDSLMLLKYLSKKIDEGSDITCEKVLKFIDDYEYEF